MTELFAEFGIDMYFDGEASPEKIKEIDIAMMFSPDEITDMVKEYLR